uniref:Uncharacterized protein n=1 Tax=Oryza nivara TaxID=4536 RepID=A0A0E0FR59_ORYNI
MGAGSAGAKQRRHARAAAVAYVLAASVQNTIKGIHSNQGFTPRKHPREEVEPEEDISPKRQQTTVKFGEASVWVMM